MENFNVGVIIQGRSDHFHEIYENLKESKHQICFSTFDNFEKNDWIIPIIRNDLPKILQFKNATLQSLGVLNSLDKFNNCDLYLKLRWDMIISSENLDLLINLLTRKYVVNKKIISYSLSINLHSMVQDWIIFGSRKQIINYFTIIPKIWNGSPEDSFFKSYLINSEFDVDDVKNAYKYFDFCIKDIIDNNIDIIIFKGRKEERDIKYYGLVNKGHIINY